MLPLFCKLAIREYCWIHNLRKIKLLAFSAICMALIITVSYFETSLFFGISTNLFEKNIFELDGFTTITSYELIISYPFQYYLLIYINFLLFFVLQYKQYFFTIIIIHFYSQYFIAFSFLSRYNNLSLTRKKYLQSDRLRGVQYQPYLYSVFNICTLTLLNNLSLNQHSISVAGKQKCIH